MRKLLILASVGTAGLAHAAGPPSADALFNEAKAAMDRGDLATACAEFAQSEQMDPAAGTLLNLAECEQRSGKLAAALGHFQEARARLPPADYRIDFADGRIASLKHRVARLAVRVTPIDARARVECDGTIMVAGAPLAVDPGRHVCVARVASRPNVTAETNLREGEAKTVKLVVGAAEAQEGTAAPLELAAPVGPSKSERPTSPGRVQGLAGLVTGAAGVVGLGIGAIFGLVAKGSYDRADTPSNCPTGPNSCNPQAVDEGHTAHTQARISTGAFIVGGLLATAGVVIYLTAPKEQHVAIAPAAGTSGAGMLVRGAW